MVGKRERERERREKEGRCQSPIQMSCTPIAWALPQIQTPSPPPILPPSFPFLTPPSSPPNLAVYIYMFRYKNVLEGKAETTLMPVLPPSLFTPPFLRLPLYSSPPFLRLPLYSSPPFLLLPLSLPPSFTSLSLPPSFASLSTPPLPLPSLSPTSHYTQTSYVDLRVS